MQDAARRGALGHAGTIMSIDTWTVYKLKVFQMFNFIYETTKSK